MVFVIHRVAAVCDCNLLCSLVVHQHIHHNHTLNSLYWLLCWAVRASQVVLLTQIDYKNIRCSEDFGLLVCAVGGAPMVSALPRELDYTRTLA